LLSKTSARNLLGANGEGFGLLLDSATKSKAFGAECLPKTWSASQTEAIAKWIE